MKKQNNFDLMNKLIDKALKEGKEAGTLDKRLTVSDYQKSVIREGIKNVWIRSGSENEIGVLVFSFLSGMNAALYKFKVDQ